MKVKKKACSVVTAKIATIHKGFTTDDHCKKI